MFLDDFYNIIDKTLGQQIHYKIVMGDCIAKAGGQTNISERATGWFDLSQRNERGDTGRMGNIKEIQDHEHIIVKESREETPWWKH